MDVLLRIGIGSLLYFVFTCMYMSSLHHCLYIYKLELLRMALVIPLMNISSAPNV